MSWPGVRTWDGVPAYPKTDDAILDHRTAVSTQVVSAEAAYSGFDCGLLAVDTLGDRIRQMLVSPISR
jgi:hypothetical protein